MERWLSGLRHTPGKRAWVTPPWVQIPLSPPVLQPSILLRRATAPGPGKRNGVEGKQSAAGDQQNDIAREIKEGEFAVVLSGQFRFMHHQKRDKHINYTHLTLPTIYSV